MNGKEYFLRRSDIRKEILVVSSYQIAEYIRSYHIGSDMGVYSCYYGINVKKPERFGLCDMPCWCDVILLDSPSTDIKNTTVDGYLSADGYRHSYELRKYNDGFSSCRNGFNGFIPQLLHCPWKGADIYAEKLRNTALEYLAYSRNAIKPYLFDYYPKDVERCTMELVQMQKLHPRAVGLRDKQSRKVYLSEEDKISRHKDPFSVIGYCNLMDQRLVSTVYLLYHDEVVLAESNSLCKIDTALPQVLDKKMEELYTDERVSEIIEKML